MAPVSTADWLASFNLPPRLRLTDSHVHMGPVTEAAGLLSILDHTGTQRTTLVSIQDPETGSGLPQSLYMKARHPNRFYVFAGLNHATRISDGAVAGPSLVQQVDAFRACGCEGLKMLEGKPTSRQKLNLPVTDVYFRDYWAHVEELQVPIVWHVNDPEEFWDPQRIPGWAAERNWGYGPHDVQKETLYGEVDEVLRRHPRLKIILAHFYFLSADLPRAERFLAEHPGVFFDLAPGIEMLYNISRTPDAGRAFFIKHAERIVYGTDLFSSLTLAQARARAGIVLRWLATAETFRIPPEADFLLGPPEDGLVHGLALPPQVLQCILQENFEALAGMPQPLQTEKAIEVCSDIAQAAHGLTNCAIEQTEASRVLERLKRQ